MTKVCRIPGYMEQGSGPRRAGFRTGADLSGLSGGVASRAWITGGAGGIHTDEGLRVKGAGLSGGMPLTLGGDVGLSTLRWGGCTL